MPELITLIGVRMDVVPDGEEIKLIVTDPTSARQYVLAMDPAAAKTIGEALLAPRVVKPPTPSLQLPR